jgi:predicted transposase YdaD
MTKRPHDALFKWAFEAPADAAALLRELLPAAVRDAIVWSTLDRERGSFVDRTLADRHNDLLFSARLRAGAPRRIFLLLEHQSTADPAMPRRMLSYQSRIWDRFHDERPAARLPPVLPVLVSNVRGGWSAPRSFGELFDPAVLALTGITPLVPQSSMLVLDLAHQSNADLAARALASSQKLALWLLRDARDPARLLANFDVWSPTLSDLGRSQSGLEKLAVLLEYVFRVVDGVTRDILYAKLRALGPSTEEITMTIAEQLHAEGHAKGHSEGLSVGLSVGHTKGRLDTLRRLLVLKFQALEPAAEARLQAASATEIDRYLERLLTADSLAAVLAD